MKSTFKTETTREITVVVILILGILFFCGNLVFSGEVPFFRDLTNYFYPLRYSLAESLRAGEFPLWDRRFAQGFPNFAGLQLGALYPPHWILAAIPFYSAIRVIFVLHFLIAAIGCYYLLRHWNYPRDLALIGSFVFTLGGVIVSLTNLLNHFQSAVWLPWLILTWEYALQSFRWRHFLYFTLTASLQLLAGSPEFFALSMGLAFLDGLRMRDSDNSITLKRIVCVAVAGSLLMIMLLMIQILPTLELIRESRRGQLIPEVEAFLWSLKPIHLLNWLFLDKEVELGHWLGVRLFFDRDLPFLVSIYLGALISLSVPLWYYYASRREKVMLTGLAVISLGLAFGGNGLFYPLVFRNFSLISFVRFPEKFFFITYVAIFLMAMRGLLAFSTDPAKSLRAPLVIMGCVCTLWIVAYYFFQTHSEVISDFIVSNTTIPPLSEQHARATVSVLTNIQRQVILTSSLFLLLLLTRTSAIRPALVSVLLVSIVYVDMAWAHKEFLFSLEPGKLEKSVPVLSSNTSRYTRYFYYPAPRNLHPAFFSVLGRPNFQQAVGLSYKNLMPNTGVFHDIEYFQEIDALNRRPYNDFLTVANNVPFEDQVKLLRIFNIGHIVSFRELPQKGVELIGRYPNYYSWIYKVKNPTPRAFVVGTVSVADRPGPTFQRMLSPQFDPAKEAILEEHVSLPKTDSFGSSIEITDYQNTTVKLQTNSSARAVLVLADSYYPGWKAYVDGQETKILKANHFHRAIELPAGGHHVEFRYEPASFFIGLTISSLTLAMICLISILAYLRRKNQQVSAVTRPLEVLQA